MTNAQAPALAKAGRRLITEAKEHMRSSRYHRRRARELYAEVEELKQACSDLGIEFVVDEPTDNHQSQRRTSGDHSSSNHA